jgi:diphosphomevalonate decarboxylase
MSALALCLCQIEQQLCTRAIPDDEFLLRSSYVARIGSGSACRSIYSPIAVWGKTESFPGSSDFWAVPAEDIHDVFSSFHDDIVIVSSKKKSVSSSAGHDLMKNHMFAHQRFEQARKNMALMACFLKEGEVFELGNKVEEEALTLHAMMMCSDPSYILMKAGTLEILDSIRSFRRDTGIPIFFTLDAGPNVHILYPDENRQEVKDFLAQEIVPHAENGRIIEDHVGSGPKQIL